MLKSLLLAAAAAALSAGAAAAASLTIAGGTPAGAVMGYDPSPWVALGSDLVDVRSATNGGVVNGGLHFALDAGEVGQATYTIMGQESGYVNYALASGSQLSETQVGHSVTAAVTTSGFLDFGFRATSGHWSAQIMNGGVSDLHDLVLTFGGLTRTAANAWTVYAYFDDGFRDWDRDDLVARIDVSATAVPAAVPVPAAGLLLGAALAGLGALRRRARG